MIYHVLQFSRDEKGERKREQERRGKGREAKGEGKGREERRGEERKNRIMCREFKNNGHKKKF